MTVIFFQKLMVSLSTIEAPILNQSLLFDPQLFRYSNLDLYLWSSFRSSHAYIRILLIIILDGDKAWICFFLLLNHSRPKLWWEHILKHLELVNFWLDLTRLLTHRLLCLETRLEVRIHHHWIFAHCIQDFLIYALIGLIHLIHTVFEVLSRVVFRSWNSVPDSLKRVQRAISCLYRFRRILGSACEWSFFLLDLGRMSDAPVV